METTPVTPPFPPPPPSFAPPPPIAPAPAPKPRRSKGWMITSIILMVLLVICVFCIGGLLLFQTLALGRGLHADGFSTAREVGPKLEECILVNGKSDNKIAVVRVDGVISEHQADGMGNSDVEVLKAELDRAAEDKHVKAVLLKVDSPGGEVLASDEIYKALRSFQDESKKPVICSMGSLAASGGYYIASSSRWIVANELTITGSIGVIMHGWNYRGLMDKVGIAPMTFKSGKFKDMLSGERATNEVPEEEHAMVQSLIDETYGKFKDVVAAGRGAAHEQNKKEGKALASDWEDYADGRVVSGTQALKLGLVDELGNFDDAVARAQKLAGIKDADLIEYRQHYDLSNFLSMFGQSGQSHDLKLNLGADLPKLHAGYMYFLYQP